MFFRKKSSSEESNVAKQGIKKMDAVVTGVILSGIVASIYGVKKLREKEDLMKKESTEAIDTPQVKKSFLDRLFRR